MSGSILIVSAQDPTAAARAVAESPAFPQVCVISPTAAARKTASAAVDGRWTFIAVEPLLGPRVSAESGDDVLARLVQGLRIVQAYDGDPILVVLDHLDILGATTLTIDGGGITHWTDQLERLLPLP
jgi:hypothetical protein